MAEVAAPLHIPRDALIGRLQEVSAEAQQKRAEAEQRIADSRAALLAAVSKLTADQVTNLLEHFGILAGESGNRTEVVLKWVEEEKFVSKPLAVTGVETAVERAIRVLSLASDKEIEVQPSDPLYSYL